MKCTPFNLVAATMLLFCEADTMSGIVKRTSMSDETVAEIISRLLRLILAHNFLEFELKQGSLDEVQADETAVGSRKHNRGSRRRRGGPIWVAGFTEIAEGKVKAMVAHVVVSRAIENLVPLIDTATAEDAQITTDCWKAYVFDAQKRHVTVNHSLTFKDSVTKACTNSCECMWNHMKRQIRSRWGRVGTEDLTTSNLRVQAGIFFANHSLAKKNPFVTLLQLVQEFRALHEVLDMAVAMEKEQEAWELEKAKAATRAKKKGRKEAAPPPAPGDERYQALSVLASAFFQSGKEKSRLRATSEATRVPAIEDSRWAPGLIFYHKEDHCTLGKVVVVSCSARKAVVEQLEEEAAPGNRHHVKRSTLHEARPAERPKNPSFAFGINLTHKKFGEVTVAEEKKTTVRVRVLSNGKFLTIYKKDLTQLDDNTDLTQPV
jgi:hypothetical protein